MTAPKTYTETNKKITQQSRPKVENKERFKQQSKPKAPSKNVKIKQHVKIKHPKKAQPENRNHKVQQQRKKTQQQKKSNLNLDESEGEMSSPIVKKLCLICNFAPLGIASLVIGANNLKDDTTYCFKVAEFLFASGILLLCILCLLLVSYKTMAKKASFDIESQLKTLEEYSETPSLLPTCCCCVIWTGLLFHFCWFLYGCALVFGGNDDVDKCSPQLMLYSKVHCSLLLVIGAVSCCITCCVEILRELFLADLN